MRPVWLFLSLVLCTSRTVIGQADDLARETCASNKNGVDILPDAPAQLGGLVGFSQTGDSGYGCGGPALENLPAYEAILWALKRTNQNSGTINSRTISDSYIPGVQVGLRVRDTCSLNTKAIKTAQDLFPELAFQSKACNSSTKQIMVGMLGGSYSSTTAPVASLMGTAMIPQIAYQATAPSLSDREKYPSFLRTIPPDTIQIKVITELLKFLKWKFIAVVYTNDVYGMEAYHTLRKQSATEGICITLALKLNVNEKREDVLRKMTQRLLDTANVTGVTYLGLQAPARRLAAAARQVAYSGRLQWIFPDTVGTHLDFADKASYFRGMLTVVPKSRKIPEFEEHWLTLDPFNPPANNPWFTEWYMIANKCKLPGVNYSPYDVLSDCKRETEEQKRKSYVQHHYVEPAIHAVYSYLKALKNAHRDRCQGRKGVCAQLLGLSSKEFFDNYLQNIDFTYSGNERIPTLASAGIEPYKTPKRVRFGKDGSTVDSSYEIYSYRYVGPEIDDFNFVLVGNYVNDKLDINVNKIQMYDNDRKSPLESLPTSLCPSTPCRGCIQPDSKRKFASLPGDILINGIFSVHKGDKCSELKSNGAQLLESFLYAVKKVRDRAQFPNILPGVTLGAIGFDDCNSIPKAQDLVLDFQFQRTQLQFSDGLDIDPKSVYSYAAAHSSDLTIAVAQILTNFKMPQVGYQATSTDLSNLEKFPYFVRTCPADDKQVTAMVHLAKRLDWSYVQVVASASIYGRSVAREFKRQASLERICPAFMFEAGTDGNMSQIVDKLRETPPAKAVFLFLESGQIKALLKALSDKKASNEFILVGSEVWGDSLSVVQGYQSAAQGAITLRLKSGQAKGFLSYLNGLAPAAYKDNPWFMEWYQATKNCYLGETNPKNYSKECPNEPINGAGEVQQESYTPYVINAVYAIAHGVDLTLKEYCGALYNGVCSKFTSDANSPLRVLENIKKVTFTDELGEEFSFKNGEGASGYELFTFQGTGYQKIGDFSIKENMLTLNTSLLSRQVSATCPQVCGECLYLYQKQKFFYQPGDLFVSGLIDVHHTGSNPFVCGALREIVGVQFSEVFPYAVDLINEGKAPVSLQGVKLGTLLMDVCKSDIRASNLVSSLHLGGLSLPDGKGSTIDMAHSLGWLSFGSSQSMEAAEILGKINEISASGASTSVLLKDRQRFPTFFRTVPPDDIQAGGMGDLCRSMGWTYVQTLNSPNSYGRSGAQAFKDYARTLGTCVSASYEFITDGDYDTIITNLLSSPSQVVIVFSNIIYAFELLKAKERNPKAAGLVFIGSEGWNNNTALFEGTGSATDGIITFKIQTPLDYNFVKYMDKKFLSNSTANPWFEEWYETLFKCDSGYHTKYGVRCSDQAITAAKTFVPDIWVTSTVEAIFAMVKAADMSLKEMCGENYNGVCPNVHNDMIKFNKLMVENMDKVNILGPTGEQIKFIDRRGSNPYEIFRAKGGKFKQIGTYSASGIISITDAQFKDSYPSTVAKCPGNCLECQYVFTKKEDYTFIPGDILLGGVFDVHKKGSNPFTCGQINTVYGFQLLEAFNYAIEYVNNKTGPFNGKLNGVTLGGVGLDACQSATRAGNLVANLHSGFLNLTTGPVPVNPSRIDAYIGAFSSDMTVQMADVLGVLGIPQISYGSTSIELKNRRKFRHFLRTVPADDKQARAMIAILKRFNLQYVQVINSAGTYGEEAASEFLRLAKENSICVAQNLTFGGNGTLTAVAANDAVSKLLSKPSATVVITILKTDDVHPFLAAVNRVSQAKDKFMFLGSEGWADNMDLIRGAGVGKVANGSVTLGMETADLSGFDKYLDNKYPGQYSRNPWFEEYYEAIFNCSLKPSSALYQRQCSFTDKFPVARSPNYRQDPYVLYTVNAVLSAAQGIHNAIVKKCGSGYNGLCENFRNSGERRQDILEGIKKAEFVDATKQKFAFNEDGEGNRGYHIYAVEQSLGNKNSYIYDNVGSYNDTHLLKIYSDFNVHWYSNCSKTGSCPECPLLGQQSSRYMQRLQSEDLNVVGVFNVHDMGKDSFKCGEMRVANGMQNLLAFFYSLDRINKNLNLNLPPSLKLGGLALDACSSGMRTRRDLFSLLAGDGLCTVRDKNLVKPDTIVTVMTMGSANSMASLDVVEPIGIPTLSPSATSPRLNGKPAFLRAVPPDTLQAKVMAEIAEMFGWSYVSAVNVDTEYGNEGVNAFIQEVKNTNKSICIATRIVLPLNLTMEQAKKKVIQLDEQKGAKAVIVFTNQKEARMLLLAAKELNLKDRFIWIGSDTWADNMDIIRGVEDVARGAITIQIRSEEVASFKQYVKELNLLNRKGIPDDWFEEFWQHMHSCRLHNSSIAQTQYSRVCNGYEIITDDKIRQDTYVLYTIISTYMVAQGINNIRECRDSTLGVAGCLSQLKQKYQRITNGTRDAQWNVLPDELTGNRRLNFKFTNRGYGDVGYSILNIQQLPKDKKNYQYKRIGFWMEKLELAQENWYGYDSNGDLLDAIPASKCPADRECDCKTRDDSEPLKPRTGQLKIPQKNENFTIAYGIIVAALTALGILVTIFLFIYLLIFYPVRGGTTILGYLLIVGILLIYVLNFAFLYLPDPTICGARRFGQGFVYAICFSAMMLKVMNTWRVGAMPEYNVTYERLSHPCSLFLIALAMVGVQVIIAVEWLILVPAKVDFIEYDGFKLPRCAPSDFHNEELVLSCVYVMLLILITLIFAIVTWDNEDNHHESRWILITCCFTIGTWLVWTIVSTLTDIKYRDPAIAIGNLVNATVMLLCIYVRKIYLLNKYQNELEEERRSQYAFSTSQKGYGQNNHGPYSVSQLSQGHRDVIQTPDGYPNVFSNHIYDNTLDTGSRKGSAVDDSGVVYVYDGKRGDDIQY